MLLFGIGFLGYGIRLIFRDMVGATMLLLSVVVLVLLLRTIGEGGFRAYIYDAEILLHPQSWAVCSPQREIVVGGSHVGICAKHDFGAAGFTDVIVQIEGRVPPEQVLHDIYVGNIDANASNALIRQAGIWRGMFVYRRLLSNYYVITNSLAGP
jgi:hypothetical protein